MIMLAPGNRPSLKAREIISRVLNDNSVRVMLMVQPMSIYVFRGLRGNFCLTSNNIYC